MSVAYVSTYSVENAHSSDIYAVVVCEKYTITGSGDGKIALWDNTSPSDRPAILNQVSKNKSGIHHLAVDGESKYLSAIYFDGTVEVYDLVELKLLSLPALSSIAGGWACAIASDKPILAVSTVAGHIVLVDLNDGSKVMATLEGPQPVPAMATCVDITADGAFVACGLDSNKVHVFSTDTGRLSYTLPCHTMTPRAVRFSPKGAVIAIAGDVDTISLFSLNGGDLIDTLPGHTSWVFSLDWNESGEFLLSVSQDTKAKIWSVATKQCVCTLTDSEKPLFSGSWIRKGWGTGVIGGVNKGVVTAGLDGTIRWYREAGTPQ